MDKTSKKNDFDNLTFFAVLSPLNLYMWSFFKMLWTKWSFSCRIAMIWAFFDYLGTFMSKVYSYPVVMYAQSYFLYTKNVVEVKSQVELQRRFVPFTTKESSHQKMNYDQQKHISETLNSGSRSHELYHYQPILLVISAMSYLMMKGKESSILKVPTSIGKFQRWDIVLCRSILLKITIFECFHVKLWNLRQFWNCSSCFNFFENSKTVVFWKLRRTENTLKKTEANQ